MRGLWSATVMDASFPRARFVVLLLLGVLLGAFSYSWGYQSGCHQSSAAASAAASDQQLDDLTRWYVSQARRAGYVEACGSFGEPDDADLPAASLADEAP